MPTLRICGVRKAPISRAVVRHHEAAQFAEVGGHGQLVELLFRGVFLQRLQRLRGQGLEVLVPGRDAHVVEPIVGAQRVRGIHLVAGRAAALAVE